MTSEAAVATNSGQRRASLSLGKNCVKLRLYDPNNTGPVFIRALLVFIRIISLIIINEIRKYLYSVRSKVAEFLKLWCLDNGLELLLLYENFVDGDEVLN